MSEMIQTLQSPPEPPKPTFVNPSSDTRIQVLNDLDRRVSNWADASQAIASVRRAISNGDKPAEDDLKRVRNALYKYGLKPAADMFRTASSTLKITVSDLTNRLKKEPWRLDRHDQSYETRQASYYSIYIHQMRHTFLKDLSYKVVWYTGNPAQRWESKSVDTIQEAVLLANQVKPHSDEITALELGEDPRGKLYMRLAMELDSKEALEKYLKDHPNAERYRHKVKQNTSKPESKGTDNPKGVARLLNLMLRKHPMKPDVAQAIKDAPTEVQKIVASPKDRKEGMTSIAKALKEAPQKVADKIRVSAHKELHEIKHAIKAVKKIGKKPPQPLNKEDKKALYATGAYVAGATIAAFPPGGALMAAGALGKAFALHVGIKAVHDLLDRGFVHFEWGESVIHGVQHLLHVAAKDPSDEDLETLLINHLVTHVTKNLESLTDEDMQTLVNEPEKQMKTASNPDTFKLLGAVHPEATLSVTQKGLNSFTISLQKDGAKAAEKLKEVLSQKEAEQMVAILATKHEAKINWIGNRQSIWSPQGTFGRMASFRFTMDRKDYVSKDVWESAPRVNPQGTDVEAFKFQQAGKWYVIGWAGKSNKPLGHYSVANEARADAIMTDWVNSRKESLRYKQQQKAEIARMRRDHSFAVGDILYSSWGYDQTNVNFYQITAVKGQKVVLREVKTKVVSESGYHENVVPAPDQFHGPPLIRMVGPGSIKIDDVSRAYPWSGKPMYQTGPYGGH